MYSHTENITEIRFPAGTPPQAVDEATQHERMTKLGGRRVVLGIQNMDARGRVISERLYPTTKRNA